MPNYPYPTLGTNINRDYRNLFNDNLKRIEVPYKKCSIIWRRFSSSSG
ncbi:hypothetical protein BACSP_04075 [Bacillus sp. T2.9-1]|jgi:hypothetical protein|nr:hypothetical protein BACSP_04075 [Bacillus sp. T2.9-1]